MKPVDYVIILMTLAICTVLLAIQIRSAIQGTVMDDHKADVMGDVITAMLAIISLYVGSKIRSKGDD